MSDEKRLEGNHRPLPSWPMVPSSRSVADYGPCYWSHRLTVEKKRATCWGLQVANELCGGIGSGQGVDLRKSSLGDASENGGSPVSRSVKPGVGLVLYP